MFFKSQYALVLNVVDADKQTHKNRILGDFIQVLKFIKAMYIGPEELYKRHKYKKDKTHSNVVKSLLETSFKSHR